MKQPKELLHHHRNLGVDLDEGLVSHEKGRHGLEARDLYGKIKGGDDGHTAKGEPVAIAALPDVVSGDGKPPSQEAHVVPSEILQKGSAHAHLSHGLLIAFW